MAKFIITEKAGHFVAGHGNPGVGVIIDLTPEAAAAAVELGALVPISEEPAAEAVAAADEVPADEMQAETKRKR